MSLFLLRRFMLINIFLLRFSVAKIETSCSELRTENESEGNVCPIINPLNGKHIRVLAMEIPGVVMTKRNATGHILEISGMMSLVLESLSRLFKFSYTYLPIVAPLSEDSTFGKGAISYMKNNEADYMLGALLATAERFKSIDYSASWTTNPLGILIPYPKASLKYVSAVVEPLAYEVWITVIVSLVVVMLLVYGFVRYRNKIKETNNLLTDSNQVIGILSKGGASVSARWIVIRILAGAWCLACFFLIQLYCSTLTSHLTSPLRKPLIDSVYDIPNTPGLQIVVDRGFAADTLLSNSNSGVFKQLGDMLRSNPQLRCTTTADCLEKMKSFGQYVYLHQTSFVLMAIAQDLRASSICHFTMAKETFWPMPAFTGLVKNSPYTEHMSRGLLRLNEVGLIKFWTDQFVPKADKCINKNIQDDPRTRLSMGHLSGAFAILLVGYVMALIVFIGEHIIAARRP